MRICVRSFSVAPTALAWAYSTMVLFSVGCKDAARESSTGNSQQTIAPAISVKTEDVLDPLTTGKQLLANGDLQGAEKAVKQALVATPNDISSLQSLLQIYAQQHKHRNSAEIAIRLVELDAPEKVALLTGAFYSYLQAGDFDLAEKQLVHALAIKPDDVQVLQILVQLLNAQGRRYEACQVAEKLVAIDFPGTGVVMSLVERSGPFQLSDFGPLIPKDRVTLFDLGRARVLDIVEVRPQAAYELCKKVTATIPNHPAVESYFGKLIAYREVDNPAALTRWLESTTAEIREFPDYWHALGIQHRRAGDDRAAVRAFAEAVRRDPTDRISLREIVSSLSRLKELKRAETVQSTINVLDEIYRSSDKNALTAELALKVADKLTELYRPWEGLRWRQMSVSLSKQNVSPDQWKQRSKRIREWYAQGTPESIQEARLRKILGFDVSEYPLADPIGDSSPVTKLEQRSKTTLRLTNVAGELGLQTRFSSGYPITKRDFLLYQANGGGLAAVDYDLDGFCDVYVVQSGGDPQKQNSSAPNQLYRNLEASSFTDVSGPTTTNDKGFGQGVCVGDLNQDGWPDIVVGNFGQNRIYINQGDGSYRDVSDSMHVASHKWTSSLAVGDVNGDTLPDIVEVNYVDDKNVFTRRCIGPDTNCHPQSFTPAVDRVFLATPSGEFVADEQFGSMDSLPNYSLGCVLADIDGNGGNDLFVTVDGGSNHYFRSEGDETIVWNEVALVSGCSVGRNGLQQACMGIAVADFDRNEKMDFAVTNFYGEPCNIFLQSSTGLFRDETDALGLSISTESTMGFGTQAADFDNDGFVDIARLNGHIYDDRENSVPFKMAPQMFHNGNGRFNSVPSDTLGTFWETESLGRTLVSFDYNGDGKVDLLANSLDQDVAVLRNDTATGNWIAIKLVGVESERDAIGAKVTVELGEQKQNAWQTSGGYMSQNELMIHFGLGDHEIVPRIMIHWPSGRRQVINNTASGQTLIVIEDVSQQDAG